MDDVTKKMLVTIVGPILRKGLISAGSALTAHGLMSSNYTEAFVSLGLALAGAAWSFWNDYGRAIVLSQLEVLKAKSLAQAAKLQAHDLAPVTAEQIAAKGPETMTPATVTKVAATLCLLLAFGLMAGPAFAQTKRFVPTGNLKADVDAAIKPSTSTSVGGTILDKAFAALAKPFQDLAAFIGEDLDGAIALSTAIPEIQDGHGQQCWMAMSTFGKIVKAHPLPLTLKVASDFEALRLHAISANQLCGNAHCTQMFADGVTMAQAASPIPLVGVPQLHDLCSKIPQIALVDPVKVPPPVTPPVAPATP